MSYRHALKVLIPPFCGQWAAFYRPPLDVGVMFVCVFEQRACRTVNFNVSQSSVANHEVRPW